MAKKNKKLAQLQNKINNSKNRAGYLCNTVLFLTEVQEISGKCKLMK